MELTIEALEALRLSRNPDIDRALVELIRIKKAESKPLPFLVGTVYTRESSLNMRISMRLVGVFVNWLNGDPSSCRLEVSTRWLVPDRDGTTEMREVMRNSNEYINDKTQLAEITAWLEAPATMQYPLAVIRILNRACADAVWHEVEENLFDGIIRVNDPHKER